MGKTAIKICPKCSGIKGKDLKRELPKGSYGKGCIGRCVKKHPELEGKAFAKIDGKLVVCESKKKLLKKMREAVGA